MWKMTEVSVTVVLGAGIMGGRTAEDVRDVLAYGWSGTVLVRTGPIPADVEDGPGSVAYVFIARVWRGDLPTKQVRLGMRAIRHAYKRLPT